MIRSGYTTSWEEEGEEERLREVMEEEKNKIEMSSNVKYEMKSTEYGDMYFSPLSPPLGEKSNKCSSFLFLSFLPL